MSTTTLTPSSTSTASTSKTTTSPSSKSHHRRRRSPHQSRSELLLSTASTSLSPSPSNQNPSQPSSHDASDPPSSRLSIILTPLLFLSFLFSLLVVDNRTRSTLHAPSTPCDKNCDREDYYHSRQRKIAKWELRQAFELRERWLGWLGYGWLWGGEPQKQKQQANQAGGGQKNGAE